MIRIAAPLLALLVLFFGPSFQASAEDGKALRGVALVIGQSDYEHLSPLPNPANDADAVEAMLSELGFDSVRRADRDAETLARDLERFAEDAEDADVAVFYYSGHGIEAGGENFLVPVDADLGALDDAARKLVPVSALIEKLKATVPVMIVMLDACRDNPFPAGSVLRAEPGAEPIPVGAGGLIATRGAASLMETSQPAPAPENVGTVIAFAAEPGMVALDGDAGGNSPYAAAVLRHLDAMAGEEFGTVMRMVAEEVYLKTGGRQRPWVNESMRRLLYLGKAPDQPEGAEGDILAERRGLLVTIAALPDRERRTIEAVASDTGVPMDALYGMLKALGSEVPEDPAKLDALLRDQTDKVKAMIAERDTLKSSDPEIVRLSDLADQALAEGALTTAIALRQQAKARAKEVEATVEDAETELRQRRIELAEVYAKSAEAYALAFKHSEAGRDYEEASRQVERWDAEQAFFYMRDAQTAYMDAGKFRGGLPDFELSAEAGKRTAAMAERLLADNPGDRQYWEDVFAQTLNNWGNATDLVYSVTDRPEVLAQSIDSFERALKVLSRDRVEQDWVVVQHNLAGSMMMLAESKDDTAMMERAVAAYEAALTVWTRDANPEKWALATSNMGSSMMKLGRHTQDLAMLEKAIASLTAALEVQTEEAMPLDWASTQNVLGDAYEERAAITHEATDLAKSVAARQAALRVYSLDRTPRLWARVMHNMAVGERTITTPENRRDAMRRAMAVYEQVLAAIDPDDLPAEYALSLGNLGAVRLEAGRFDKDQPMIESAIAALRETVGIYERLQRPNNMALNLETVGEALTTLGNMRSSTVEPQQAIESYERAMDLYRQAGEPKEADRVRGDLAAAQAELGYQRFLVKDPRGSLEAYRASLDNRDRALDPEGWRFSATQVAISLQNLGAQEKGVDTLREAAEAYRLALSAIPADAPQEWSTTQDNLIVVLRTIGERSLAAPDQIALAEAYGAVVARKDNARNRDGRNLAQANRAAALSLAGEYGSDLKLMEQAEAAYRQALEPGDLPTADRVFHTLNLSRTLFLAANLGGGDAARRESVAVIDANWPLIEKEGDAEQKVFALMDRANLMSTLATADPEAYSADQVEAAYERAVAAADQAAEPALWRNAQTALASHQLAGMEAPDFPPERIHSGLGTLRALLDATPKPTDPKAWADFANWYGYALGAAGRRENTAESFAEALPLLRDAIAVYEAANDENGAAHTRDSLCGALVGLGRLQKERALISEGAENCEKAVTFMRAQNLADVLPIAEANLADARKALAEVGGEAR